MNMRVRGSILPHPSSDNEFTINGVPISNIVTKGSSVTFLARKTIKNLVVKNGVNVRLVNGVSVATWVGSSVLCAVELVTSNYACHIILELRKLQNKLFNLHDITIHLNCIKNFFLSCYA